MTFSINDDDLYPNGAPFGFDIIQGNDGGEFRVNSQGNLVTASRFNHHIKSKYQLVVRVFDNGSPSLYSDMPVDITIIEEGTNPPTVTSLSVSINSMGKLPGGTMIGHMLATDEDLFDRLSYEVVSKNRHLFDVDKKNGMLFNTEELDAGRYVVNISVSDGRYTRFGSADVDVDEITSDMMDSSITIQFKDISVRDFIQFYKRNLQKFLKRKLKIRMRDVQFINIQPSDDLDFGNTGSRSKRAASDNLDILFAARKAPSTYISRGSMMKKLTKFTPDLENELGLKVLRLFTDVCSPNSCPEGRCEGVVRFEDDGISTMLIEGETYVLAKHSHSYKCLCDDGSYGASCGTTTQKVPCPFGQNCAPKDEICTHFSCQTGKSYLLCKN